MPINADYEYINAERAFFQAQTLDEKIRALEEMISKAPSHKGAENLRAGLKARLKKFQEKKEKAKSTGKTTKKAIKKEGFQIVLLGLTNGGKSQLISRLTNARPRVDSYPFTSKVPEIGTFDYEGVRAQMVDLPSIGSEAFDIGIANTADCMLLVVEQIEDLEKINPVLSRTQGKKIIVINKADLLEANALRKLEEKIKSKKLNAIIISAQTGFNIDQLKEKILSEMKVNRIYLKEPGKVVSKIPMVMRTSPTVKEVAEKIYKGFSTKIKETRVTGPSSKFPNQKVGLSHVLKDRDIVEFHGI